MLDGNGDDDEEEEEEEEEDFFGNPVPKPTVSTPSSTAVGKDELADIVDDAPAASTADELDALFDSALGDDDDLLLMMTPTKMTKAEGAGNDDLDDIFGDVLGTPHEHEEGSASTTVSSATTTILQHEHIEGSATTTTTTTTTTVGAIISSSATTHAILQEERDDGSATTGAIVSSSTTTAKILQHEHDEGGATTGAIISTTTKTALLDIVQLGDDEEEEEAAEAEDTSAFTNSNLSSGSLATTEEQVTTEEHDKTTFFFLEDVLGDGGKGAEEAVVPARTIDEVDDPAPIWVALSVRGLSEVTKPGPRFAKKAAGEVYLETDNWRSEAKKLELIDGFFWGADFSTALLLDAAAQVRLVSAATSNGFGVVAAAKKLTRKNVKGTLTIPFECDEETGTLTATVLERSAAMRDLAAVVGAHAPTLEQAYAFSEGEHTCEAYETVVEPVKVLEIVAAIINPVADAMLEASACWLARSERARADAAAFVDDDEAQRNGARRLRLTILGARGLERRSRGARQKDPDVTKSFGDSFRAVKGLAARLRAGETPRLGAGDSGGSVPSPFARARLVSSVRPEAVPLGRTNTEYASESPSWGANARVESCSHAKPSTSFVATAPARLVGPPPASICPVIEAYLRRDEEPVIIIEVMDERYSVAEGIKARHLGTLKLPLPKMRTEESKPQWLPLTNDEGSGGQVYVQVELLSLDDEGDEGTADAAYLEEQERRLKNADRDLLKLHAWLEIAGVAVDPDASKSVAMHDAKWLRSHARALARDAAQLRRFADDAEAALQRGETGFKSSMLKSELKLAALPTNLHAHFFSVDGELWCGATSGAPTAAATLGATKGGLLRLESSLEEMRPQTPEAARGWEALAAACGVRKTLVVAQALTLALTAVRAKVVALLLSGKGETLEAWVEHGAPLVFEALVSTTGSELAMLEDSAAAINALKNYKIKIVYEGDDEMSIVLPSSLQIPESVLGVEIRLLPMLFAQGLDAKQSMANQHAAFTSRLGVTGALSAFNKQMGRSEVPTSSGGNLPAALNLASLETLRVFAMGTRKGAGSLRQLTAAVGKEQERCDNFEKHWLILVEAERAARTLDCCFVVFCKSGKDRTGMAVTLANAMLIGKKMKKKKQKVDQEEEEKIMLSRASILREHGPRLRVCHKNTGRMKYAFNVIQREFLPNPYRPPLSCIEDIASSIMHADTS